MSRSARSVSLDDDTWYKLQHEAREKNLPLSNLVEEKVFSSFSQKECGCNINNINNIILINNNILLLSIQHYQEHLEKEIKQKEKEIITLKETRDKQMKEVFKIIEKFEEIVTKSDQDRVIKQDFTNDNEGVFTLCRELKTKYPSISFADIRAYHEYSKLKVAANE